MTAQTPKIETAFEAVRRIQENGSEGSFVLLEQGRVAVVTDSYVLTPMEG